LNRDFADLILLPTIREFANWVGVCPAAKHQATQVSNFAASGWARHQLPNERRLRAACEWNGRRLKPVAATID
jgi:hypothetical protein